MDNLSIIETTSKPLDLLLDPQRLTITVSQAAVLLGVSVSTAHHAHRRTGYLMDGVQVLRVGRRCVVSTASLRRVLGLADPV